jgi:integrase
LRRSAVPGGAASVDKRLAEGAGSADARGTKSAEVPASGTNGSLWHALRHTYASLCVAAKLSGLEVSRFMGHSKPTTTLVIYTHLFNTDDHAGAMAALGAMEAAPLHAENVVPLWG